MGQKLQLQQRRPESLSSKPLEDPGQSTSHRKGPKFDNSSRVAMRRDANQEWAAHMPAIKRLYIDEDRPLREVMDIMSRDYGFIRT